MPAVELDINVRSVRVDAPCDEKRSEPSRLIRDPEAWMRGARDMGMGVCGGMPVLPARGGSGTMGTIE